MTSSHAAETTPRELTVAMEDAIVGIYRLQETTDERVSTSELAAELGVEPPSVSSIFSRLAERGLIDREPHRPVALTETGMKVALQLIRNHRLLETFLVECLGYGWEEVHEECDRLEHHVSQRFTTSLESFLSNPETDPHGDPIPDTNLDVPTESNLVHLDTVDEGTTVTVQRILTGERETLEYLASRGLEPEDTVTVEERTPIGLLVISTATGQPRLPTETARQIICSHT
ncbi:MULTISPECIES: metal-dependent transcriptional regulator [Haloferax]|nr:metal-dependent transcriptional regulator [Haloferax mediterranei]AFK21070.1 transcription repressor [Haloferax mediterranei ATCC 33500]AHZ24074.1 transcription repressor [Haloferax mediterranei ATCC 33500]MDX5989777.1 metal-dependent transcriptional regulator [Haloferax mediterranei ATCC 33500]